MSTPVKITRESGAEGGGDRRRVRGDATRRAILARAVDIASVEGLEGLSLGRLAGDLQMSKSGLFAHFGSKEELQLAALRAARAILAHEVVEPAAGAPQGIARLDALLQSWISYMRREVFPGGCVYETIAAEFASRDGRLHDAIAAQMLEWRDALELEARHARDAGELAPGVDPRQLVWELEAFGRAANGDFQLHRDADTFDRTLAAVRERLDAAATASGRRRLDR